MSLLEKAIAIAVEAHQGKKDKAGQPTNELLDLNPFPAANGDRPEQK